MAIRRFFLLSTIFLTLTTAQTGRSQPSAQDSLRPAPSIFALPLAFYTPETNWGFGAAGILAFRFAGQLPDSRPSQMQLGFAYTLNKQFLAYLPYQLYLGNERHFIYGELGWYKYSYEFYGIGNSSSASDKELYGVNYPRLRINALQSILSGLYLGLRYWMDHFDIYDLQPDGLLANTHITGQHGGLLSGLGVVGQYDRRDNVFYPASGSLAELVLFYNGRALGSGFNYGKLYLDASQYLPTSWGHILALNLYAEFTFGDAPFNQLALLGGTRRMRGYYEGRFRDKQLVILQTEYRFPLFWRLKGALFGGAGRVANTIHSFSLSDIKWSGGGGLRVLINKKERIHIRLDAAFGQAGNSGYYVTIGEAF